MFFEEERFFKPEDYGKSFPRQVVRLKYFDEDFGDDSVEGVRPLVGSQKPFQLVDEKGTSYRSRRVRDRTGQAVFRQKVLAAYGQRCCVRGESSLEVLNAAHIQPYVNSESNHIQNGLAFRTDLHKLFDAGLITIDDDYRLVTSNRLKSGGYASYHGQKVFVPDEVSRSPQRRPWKCTGQ